MTNPISLHPYPSPLEPIFLFLPPLILLLPLLPLPTLLRNHITQILLEPSALLLLCLLRRLVPLLNLLLRQPALLKLARIEGNINITRLLTLCNKLVIVPIHRYVIIQQTYLSIPILLTQYR